MSPIRLRRSERDRLFDGFRNAGVPADLFDLFHHCIRDGGGDLPTLTDSIGDFPSAVMEACNPSSRSTCYCCLARSRAMVASGFVSANDV